LRRRLIYFAVAVLSLAAAGAAIAWGGGVLKTDAVSARFSVERTLWHGRSCAGSDGHTYLSARAVLVGTATSDDARLSGKALFRLWIREDTTSGLGTASGHVWIGDNLRKVSARLIGVLRDGALDGVIQGRAIGSGLLVANFTATWNGTTLEGSLGDSTTANPAVIQTRRDVRCAGGAEHGDENKAGTTSSGSLEVRKVLVPSDDPGRFDLRIDGKSEAAGVGNNGSTGEETVKAGKHAVSETAAAGSSLDAYTTAISCSDANGKVLATGGADADLDVEVAAAAHVTCTITNTRKVAAQ
jgi:hypothetical protein